MILLVAVCLTAAIVHGQEKETKTEKDSVAERTLEGIVVKAQRQLVRQEADRLAYDVTADELAKGENVSEVLQRVPLVAVDGQGNILVRGSSNFKVYRNGRPDPNLTKNAKEILQNMPASTLKRIEVITDPGAREDAEGTQCILNLVTAERYIDGATATLKASYNSLLHPNLGTFLTARKGKAVCSFNYGFGGMSKRETSVTTNSERTFEQSGNQLFFLDKSKNPGNVHYTDLSASYDINAHNLLSVSAGGYFYNLDVRGNGNASSLDATGNLLYAYDENYRMKGYSHHSWNGRADYEHRTHLEGEILTFSYMLALTRQHSGQETAYSNIWNPPFSYAGFLTGTRENFAEHTLQADWLRPLAEHHQLQMGTKYIRRLADSHTTQQHFTSSPMSTDSPFRHTTHVAAAYADYLFTLGNWTTRAGLRYEYSHLGGHYPDRSNADFHKRLGDWVPHVSVQFRISDEQSIRLIYNTAIRRPGISYLNPATVITPTSVDFGNPHLRSGRQQSLTAHYTLTRPHLTFQFAPCYKDISSFGRINYALGDVRYATWGNVEKLHRLQFEGYVQWQPFERTIFVMNGNLWHDNLRSSANQLQQRGWSGFYSATLTQRLPLRMRLTLGSFGQIGNGINNVYSYSRSWIRYSLSLQRSFLKDDRLTLRLSAFTPFQKHITQTVVQNQGDWTGTEKTQEMGRNFQISLSWRIGNLKAQVKKTESTIENDDLVGGIGKGGKS